MDVITDTILLTEAADSRMFRVGSNPEFERDADLVEDHVRDDRTFEGISHFALFVAFA
jgi:UDP-glucose 6-dehydrogenase